MWIKLTAFGRYGDAASAGVPRAIHATPAIGAARQFSDDIRAKAVFTSDPQSKCGQRAVGVGPRVIRQSSRTLAFRLSTELWTDVRKRRKRFKFHYALAEAVRFELTVRLPSRRFSRPLP
jgi:hypothetical protein